jgi:hypothetical protein
MQPTPSASQSTDMSVSASNMTPIMRAAIDTVDDCLAELANSVEAYSNLRAKLCCVIVDNSTVIADMSGACCVLSDNYSVTGEMTDIIDAFNEMTNRCQDLCTMYSMM